MAHEWELVTTYREKTKTGRQVRIYTLKRINPVEGERNWLKLEEGFIRTVLGLGPRAFDHIIKDFPNA